MDVIVFRPEPGATRTAEALRQRGHHPVVSPALEERVLAVDDQASRLATAIVFTSPRAPALLAAAGVSHRPAYAVGPTTAEAARLAGFQDVVSGPSGGKALAALIADQRRPAEGALLHACGAEANHDLESALQANGFQIRRMELYAHVFASHLSVQARAALQSSPPKAQAAIVTSPRTASATERLLADAGLARVRASLTVYAMSAEIAARLKQDQWRDVRVPKQPRMPALLDLIDADASHLSETGALG